MKSRPDPSARASAGYARLRNWLVEAAVPLWSQAGVEASGAFHETLDPRGPPIDGPRRARVQPRQLYALQTARKLGASLDDAILRQGLHAFTTRYVRSDGLIRTLVAGDGRVLDETAVLYDQAFALLALASLAPLLGQEGERSAMVLLRAIGVYFGRPGGFETTLPASLPLASNPHMHLLEACLAWMAAGGDPAWAQTAGQIVTLTLDRFIDPVNGALREFFDGDWRPAAGEPGRIVEPGHQFEWAWLLLSWSRLAKTDPLSVPARVAALRLIANAEDFGVDPSRNVAMNSLLDDFSIHDAKARLWPQTERIKAWALASTQLDAPWWDTVADAVEGLELYLRTPVQGLWFDNMTADGDLVDGPAPASSFYHIVCAIEVLGRALGDVRCAA
uniref:Mannose-6-phosphate isomerase n=1 Tax=Caulobacter sp. (strain K31) TaxID=366602 RepID=B0T7S1_CAUSK